MKKDNMETKKCSKCGEVKSLELFNKDKYNKDGLKYHCKDCDKVKDKENRKKFLDKSEYITIYQKECKDCGEIKSIDEFNKDKYNKDGYRSYCKHCSKKRYKITASNTKEKILIDISSKTCSTCFEVKDINSFNKRRVSKDGYSSECKECTKIRASKHKEWRVEYMKEYNVVNSERLREVNKKYYYSNIEKIKETSKQYREKNRDTLNERERIKIKNNPLHKTKKNIRRLINLSFTNNGYTKKSKTFEILGCSYEFFKEYLESKFEPWMNWDNYGKYNGEFNYGFDIDHIIPLSSAKSEEDIIRLNHYTNLQPLCSKVNRDIKKDKY